MPRGGVEHRAEQMALLAGLVHERGTNPRYEELLGTLEGSALVRDAESPEAVNVRELRRAFDRERKKPRRLVEESARVTARASQAWADARERDDFQSFAPWLDRVFALAREEADAVGFIGERYQALLDDYEPGMTVAQLEALFDAPRKGAGAARAGGAGRAAAAGLGRARARVSPRTPAGARTAGRGGAWLRPRGRPPRRGAAPVLHGHRPRGHPDGAALPRARLRPRILRPAARNRACAVRPGARSRALRNAHGGSGIARSSRVAIAPVGESRRTQPGILAARLSADPGRLSRAAARRLDG